MSRSKLLIALVVLPVAVLLALLSVGVASARSPHDPAQGYQPAIATITISGFTYQVPASVLHGARVKVVNQDGVKPVAAHD